MYIVKQNFKTLGDSCREVYKTSEEASAAAAALRNSIAEWIAGMDAEPGPTTGSAAEIEAWSVALGLSSGNKYSIEAGLYVASKAVEVTVEQD